MRRNINIDLHIDLRAAYFGLLRLPAVFGLGAGARSRIHTRGEAAGYSFWANCDRHGDRGGGRSH